MPLISTFSLDEHTKLCVWKIEEDIDFFLQDLDFTSFDNNEFHIIKNEKKRLQWLASRYLLKKMSAQKSQLILKKNANGKPYLDNFPLNFSISHSFEYVAVIVSDKNVALDIEKINEKVLRVKEKFINEDDFSKNDLFDVSLIWSAKESIYKYVDHSNLSLKQNFKVYQKEAQILKATAVNEDFRLWINVRWLQFDDFVLTYIW